MSAAPMTGKLFLEAGGFTNRTIFNEDMIYAGNAVLDRGQAIVYAAKARVIHSHNYGCIAQLKRNFDLAVSQADHPEVFDGNPLGERGNPAGEKDVQMAYGTEKTVADSRSDCKKRI